MTSQPSPCSSTSCKLARVTPYCRTCSSTPRPAAPANRRTRARSICRSRRRLSGLPAGGRLKSARMRRRSPIGCAGGGGVPVVPNTKLTPCVDRGSPPSSRATSSGKASNLSAAGGASTRTTTDGRARDSSFSAMPRPSSCSPIQLPTSPSSHCSSASRVSGALCSRRYPGRSTSAA